MVIFTHVAGNVLLIAGYLTCNTIEIYLVNCTLVGCLTNAVLEEVVAPNCINIK